jgi:hypothetical protein
MLCGGSRGREATEGLHYTTVMVTAANADRREGALLIKQTARACGAKLKMIPCLGTEDDVRNQVSDK